MATAPTLPSELLYFILSMYTSCAVDKLLVSSPQLGPTSSDTTRTVNAVSRIMNFMSSQLQPSEVMVIIILHPTALFDVNLFFLRVFI